MAIKERLSDEGVRTMTAMVKLKDRTDESE